MKKLLSVAALLAFSAAPALAVVQLGSGEYMPGALQLVDGVNALITAQPLEESAAPVERHANNNMFAAMTGPYQAFANRTGNLGYDDYQGLTQPFGPGDADGNSPLEEFGFVGGVNAAGGVIQFQFFNVNGDLTDFFDVALPAGNFIWTITTGPDGHPPFSDPFFTIANSGFVQAVSPAGSLGVWYLSATAPTVGVDVDAPGFGTGPDNVNPALATSSHRFRLDVPEPASLALLALGGLFAARRRK